MTSIQKGAQVNMTALQDYGHYENLRSQAYKKVQSQQPTKKSTHMPVVKIQSITDQSSIIHIVLTNLSKAKVSLKQIHERTSPCNLKDSVTIILRYSIIH
jgi:flagellar hook-basal body complex protein FliE